MTLETIRMSYIYLFEKEFSRLNLSLQYGIDPCQLFMHLKLNKDICMISLQDHEHLFTTSWLENSFLHNKPCTNLLAKHIRDTEISSIKKCLVQT